MCPTEHETVPVAGPSDQQDSEQDTIVVLRGRGQGASSSSSLAIPSSAYCPCHEREDMAAIPVMVNCFEVSLFMYLLLLLLSCIKYAINWH